LLAQGVVHGSLPASLEWKGEVLPVAPVDDLSVLAVCDNVMDMLLPDERTLVSFHVDGYSIYSARLPAFADDSAPAAPADSRT
jgi:hypothetical protein